MSTQQYALRLADELVALHGYPLSIKAAVELRRLHAELETYKRLYEQRGQALARSCIACGHSPAVIRTANVEQR